jgi:nucleotide-binding universal stress UspA family protein
MAIDMGPKPWFAGHRKQTWRDEGRHLMAMARWNPRQTYTKQEEWLMRRLGRTRKLFAFLRAHRHELFDDALQAELETMYRDTGAGKPPVPPAMLAMVTLLQAYLKVSDAEAVELSVMDRRWQLVLDCLEVSEPPFSQGALGEFRVRLIRTDLDRRLLERTVEVARQSKAFDPRKLPKTLRVAFDASVLEGAGRVEDTLNLLGHAARKVVACVAVLLGCTAEAVARQAGIPVLLAPSVKAGLDVDWTDPQAPTEALQRLVHQLEALEAWVQRRLPEALPQGPLREHVATLHQVQAQDLEPQPNGQGVRVREGVAPERRCSIEDAEMRHGRKSKHKRFNGYKRHLATDLDHDLILACAVTPANRPEAEAAEPLKADIERREVGPIDELYIDCGYLSSPVVPAVRKAGGAVICRPWGVANGEVFSKPDFKLNLQDRTITCPGGYTESFRLGTVVEFPAAACDRCPLRAQCTTAALGHGRTVHIAEDEPFQHRLRQRAATRAGRAQLRQRVEVEHRLAHLGARQGRRARYKGVRKNLFDVRRTAAVLNLQTLQRKTEEQEWRTAA